MWNLIRQNRLVDDREKIKVRKWNNLDFLWFNDQSQLIF